MAMNKMTNIGGDSRICAARITSPVYTRLARKEIKFEKDFWSRVELAGSE